MSFSIMKHSEAEKKALGILESMSLDEKINLLGGVRGFFIPSNDRLGLPEIFMSDASGGVNIRETWLDDRVDTDLEKSVAFPCLLQLAATWNRDLCRQYAISIGEECRAGGIHILLGPGMNIYRHSQCGRNFEYLGEDPYLAAQLIGEYVRGLQSTGVAATLKHFIANNTDYHRRKSNSIVGDRALHEIYLPAFQAGIDAGAMAVMTAYNLFRGEWCSQNKALIEDILRNEMGFKWLVMTDWWAINDCEKAVKSGLDLEMPANDIFKMIPALLKEEKIIEEDLNRMVLNILKTSIAMDFYNGDFQDKDLLTNFPDHEKVALQTAGEGIVLLKNRDRLLPLINQDKISLTGRFAMETARGGGASEVEGFNHTSLQENLQSLYGESLEYKENPTDEEISSAQVVILSTGTLDSEGYDRAFALPEKEELVIKRIVKLNPRTVVVVSAGGGIRMTDWNDDAAAILYSWYGGQAGNRAVAEILKGNINPSGKLPITIEREFSDSPGADYIPQGEELYQGWNHEGEKAHEVYDIHYNEDIFVGYRWYDREKITPLYHFGEGLSYTDFEYSDFNIDRNFRENPDIISLSFKIKNIGDREGRETAQVYVSDNEASVPRPEKELKAFSKIQLSPGEEKTVKVELDSKAFSFWDSEYSQWRVEPGRFTISVGPSSHKLRLQSELDMS